MVPKVVLFFDFPYNLLAPLRAFFLGRFLSES
jgi:hypothetical protein